MAFKDFFPPQAPTVASNSAPVPEGRRERIIIELHRWEDCGFASSADDIADRIVEQPAVVVMPEEPSEAVIYAAVTDAEEECIDAYWIKRIYRAIFAALKDAGR